MKEYILSKQRRNYVEKNLKKELFLRKYFSFFYRGFKEKWVDLNKIDLHFSKLPNLFDGYRIVHISDFHMGTWMTSERLAGIVKMVNMQKPDLIVFTGDFFSYGIDHYRESLTRILSDLKSNDGIFFVMGNHDYWNGHEKVRKIANKIGMVELTNQVIAIRKENEEILFSGTDSAYVGRYGLGQILDKIPDISFSVILSHEPDTADQSAATGKFDLQLSGHSHGGQMIFPFLKNPPIRVRHAHKYPIGLYQIENMILYPNRGLGTSIVPFRINCKPEISVFNLKQSQ